MGFGRARAVASSQLGAEENVDHTNTCAGYGPPGRGARCGDGAAAGTDLRRVRCTCLHGMENDVVPQADTGRHGHAGDDVHRGAAAGDRFGVAVTEVVAHALRFRLLVIALTRNIILDAAWVDSSDAPQ